MGPPMGAVIKADKIPQEYRLGRDRLALHSCHGARQAVVMDVEICPGPAMISTVTRSRKS